MMNSIFLLCLRRHDTTHDDDRNELYNAYGEVTDDEAILHLVSPCRIEAMENWSEDGGIFAELGTEKPSLVQHLVQTHAIFFHSDNLFLEWQFMACCTLLGFFH